MKDIRTESELILELTKLLNARNIFLADDYISEIAHWTKLQICEFAEQSFPSFNVLSGEHHPAIEPLNQVFKSTAPAYWTIILYRRDSQANVIYDYVKHYWWEGDRLVISQLSHPLDRGSSAHHYWTWHKDLISHVKAERM